eukprot:scaffold106642_cov32-Tisochrysis_lutea.AAC.1
MHQETGSRLWFATKHNSASIHIMFGTRRPSMRLLRPPECSKELHFLDATGELDQSRLLRMVDDCCRRLFSIRHRATLCVPPLPLPIFAPTRIAP